VKTSFSGVSGQGNRVVKVPGEELRIFAQGVYVDSPVYFARNPVVRAINWGKLDAALALFPGEEERQVLDLACGNGVMLPTLSGRFVRVVGVDLHVSAAERLRRARGLQNVPHPVGCDPSPI
jgi:methylase of polypeptide subunit release factors